MILDKFSLAGRCALVTGASRGIGRACAIGYAEAGADVALVSRSEGVWQTAGEIEKLGRRTLVLQEDLAEPESAARVVEATEQGLGGLDILLNNAGTTRRSRAEQFSDEDWNYVLEVNLQAVFRLCRAAGGRMLERG